MESLLVGRKFPVSKLREHAGQDRVNGPRRRIWSRPEGWFHAFPCIFPVDQGFRPQRRVRDRLRPPPPSLPTQRLFGKSARRPGKSRDSAGFWARGFAHPNRRLRVPSPKEAAARVFLCCQVGRFGFALDSPHRRPGLSRAILRVRILLAPPFSLLLQRLPARTPAQPEKSPRFRGVLAVEPWCIRTGDCGFRA